MLVREGAGEESLQRSEREGGGRELRSYACSCACDDAAARFEEEGLVPAKDRLEWALTVR